MGGNRHMEKNDRLANSSTRGNHHRCSDGYIDRTLDIAQLHHTHKIIPIAMGSGMVLTGAYNNTVLQGHDTGMSVPPNEIEPHAPNADSTSYSVHWIRGHLQHIDRKSVV